MEGQRFNWMTNGLFTIKSILNTFDAEELYDHHTVAFLSIVAHSLRELFVNKVTSNVI